MLPTRIVAAATALALGAALLAGPASQAAEPAPDGRDDVVVVAVIDGSFSPYHWDFTASRMPQHVDADPSNDLPLDQPPSEWIPGFPSADTFKSFNELDLSEGKTASTTTASLQTKDAATWSQLKASAGVADAGINYAWIPDSKFVGVVDFGGAGWRATNADHGANTSAVATGNTVGSCPECVLVGITYSSGTGKEDALSWAMSQPWIDVITNSYGFSAGVRDRLYSGSDEARQRTATERGQTVFFSSGNGQAGDFSVPNTTYYSSQEGPDWIVTVGAVGDAYPSIGGTTVTGKGLFGGTSNATPVTAGIYAKALWWARNQLAGPSKAQAGGVVASGDPVACGPTRPACELGDGQLTAAELRTRLFEGAVRTTAPLKVGTSVVGTYVSTVPAPEEYKLAAQGYGTYFGKLTGEAPLAAEVARITGPMDGSKAALVRPAGERDWIVVDSYCRQQIWGEWQGGAWKPGTALPGPAPTYPLRNALAASCDQMFAPL
jgi:hypothetical protein